MRPASGLVPMAVMLSVPPFAMAVARVNVTDEVLGCRGDSRHGV